MFPPLALLQAAPGSVHQLEVILILLSAVIVVFSLLANRLQIPYPIVLFLVGLPLGFIPGVPSVTLDPDIIFLAVLPPLLFQAAWLTPWREFRFHLVSIGMLAFGLVAFTVGGVALFAPALLPGFDWRLGFILGAVVATTDAIAATSIARRIGLPRTLVDILEGESLLNDAAGLLALDFGLDIVVRGLHPSITTGFLRLFWLTLGGVALGLLVGFLVDRFERHVDDGPLEILMSLLIPYSTYLGAEAIHASGVLAVVACGLFLSRRSAEFFSADVRLQAGAVWEALGFALNGLTFVLIGLQLPAVWAGIPHANLPVLLLRGALFSLLLITLRMIWIYPGARIANRIRTRLLHQQVPMPSARHLFVAGWTGMRGAVSLAAALAIPATLANGRPLTARNEIVFCTFCVIFVTLAVQGLTLPSLVRFLGIASPATADNEELHARRTLLEEALAYLTRTREEQDASVHPAYDQLVEVYRVRLASLEGDSADPQANFLQTHHNTLAREMITVQRRTAFNLRNRGHISDEIHRRLERELDLAESKLHLSAH